MFHKRTNNHVYYLRRNIRLESIIYKQRDSVHPFELPAPPNRPTHTKQDVTFNFLFLATLFLLQGNLDGAVTIVLSTGDHCDL